MRTDRLAARAAGDIKFIGRVCTKCGGNVRYVRSGFCVPCQARNNKAIKEVRDAPDSFAHRVFVIGTPHGMKK